MAEFWGTALDGELAYRHDRMTTALQRPQRPDRIDGTLRPVKPAQTAHPRISAARGWLLRGSGAWHVAR